MQGFQARNPMARVEELRGAGEQPQHPWVGAGGIGDLADAVERLVTGVRAHAQDRLGFIDHDQQALVASGFDDLQHAAEVVEGIAAADVALDARHLLGGRGDVAAAAEPRDQSSGLRHLALLLEAKDGLDHADEVLWCLTAGEGSKVGLQPLLHLLVEVSCVFVFAGGDQGVFHPSNPAIKDVAEGTAGAA